MAKRNPSRGRSKRSRGAADTRRALAPGDVLALFRKADAPLKWPEVRGLAGSHRGPDSDRLRGLLRGLCHSGELYIDAAGAYHLSEWQGTVEGLLEATAERGGFLLRGDDDAWPVRLVRRSRLRAGDRVGARIVEDQAVIVAVVERSSRPLVGRLVAGRSGWYVLSESPDFRGRLSLTPDGHGESADGDSVSVKVVGEDDYGLIGEVVGVVARRDDEHTASTTLLAAHDVPTEWPDGIDEFLQRLPDQVTDEVDEGRTDLRSLPLVTIDGETARDFDDAVYCERRPRGGWRLVVAIADVAEYVDAGSVLDAAALERGNSVYLADRVVPMLPEALSNDLCSLRPDVPRLALVCDMQISARGRVTGHDFYEALIRSWSRFTYTAVAEILGSESDSASKSVRKEARERVDTEVLESLDALFETYQALRTERAERGALDFESQELNLILENGLLERIEPVQRNDAHKLIEEAMIAANLCAAGFLEKHQQPGLYRVHEGPTGKKFDDLRQALAGAGIRLPEKRPTPSDLARIVEGFAERPDRELLQTLVLRSMTQALYTPTNAGHFGLALQRYMHFTSPIRRYADLVVHRQIKSILRYAEGRAKGRAAGDGSGGGAGATSEVDLLQVGLHISMTERRAEDVERAVENWLKCEYAQQFVGQTFTGRVASVVDFGLFIELETVHIEGLLHISNLGGDYFQLSPAGTSLVGDRSGRHFDLGSKFEVVLADVDVEARKIDLLLPEGRSGKRGRSRRPR